MIQKRFDRYRCVAMASILASSIFGAGVSIMPGAAMAQDGIAPAMACESLTRLSLLDLDGAPSRIDSAEEVEIDGKGRHCVVKGYSASAVRFEVRMPIDTWTGRFLMLGCGGYCGAVNADPATNQARLTTDCAPLTRGEFVTASSDLGHRRSDAWFPDVLWAHGNPGAMVDFAYDGMNKTTIAANAIMEAYYGREAEGRYFVGCSDGGRQGLMMAQRYPEAFDGIVVGAPVIDKAVNDSMYHSWGVFVNKGEDGQPILTADKIAPLHAAVMKSCADAGGLIQDERLCDFNPEALLCKAGDAADCLTAAQVEVAEKLYRGPGDGSVQFSAGKMPLGSELAWIGTLIPATPGDPMDHSTLGDAAWSYDYPQYGSSFDTPTGLDYATINYDMDTYRRLTELSQLTDPNDPDLSAFRDAGGKMILWIGSADPGVPPRSTLNYYAAVRDQMGDTQDFLRFYMLPGVNHCGGGPNEALMDFLTPMIGWVEQGTAPEALAYTITLDDGVTASRPVFPYPSMVVHDGSGDVNMAASWSRADLPEGLVDTLAWQGLENYRPDNAMWCHWEATSMVCETR